MRRILLTLAALTLIGCGEHTHPGEGIEISNARINPPLPGQTTGVAFMELINYDDSDRLLAITSSASDRIELHTHLNEDGVMKMRRIDGVDLPHVEAVALKPGSFHVMMFDTSVALGDEVVLTLDFENADDLTVVAPVVLRGEMPSGDADHGSHSGH
ncbi:MAG: copper chaperone PCu(A)C [Litorimonas sp.]